MSIYNLEDTDENTSSYLTHKGQILGVANMTDKDGFSSDEEDNRIGKEVVNNLHFGGGFVAKPGNGGQSDYEPSKNRMDAFKEIVMKSKLMKMERREAKDAFETGTNTRHFV